MKMSDGLMVCFKKELRSILSILKMLNFGIRIKNRKEVLGQIPTLLVSGIKSFVGKVPLGNTGGVNVPPYLAMEITNDLEMILIKFNLISNYYGK